MKLQELSDNCWTHEELTTFTVM